MIEHSSGWMDAYYFSFSETGETPIDVILSAVARAGKAYHHTESWSSEDCDPYEPGIHRGASCVEWIQNAAADAAAEFKSLREHERQTHERLGAILGTDDSLEECAKRLRQRVEELIRERDEARALKESAQEDAVRAFGMVSRLRGLIRDALSCDPAVRPVEWVEWRIRAAKGE